MLQRCAAIRGDVEGKEDSSAIPGAPLDSANVGHRLLRAMGLTPGEGLGVRQEGRLQSVAEELVVQHSRAGLRAVHEQPKSHAKSHGSGQNNRTASSVAFSSRTCVLDACRWPARASFALKSCHHAAAHSFASSSVSQKGFGGSRCMRCGAGATVLDERYFCMAPTTRNEYIV